MEKNQTMQQNSSRSSCLLPFKVTKMFLILLCSGLLMGWIPVKAQDGKITLNVKEMPLGDVVKELKKQTGKDFLFSNREVNVVRKISVNVTGMALKEVLPLVFGKDFRFEISQEVVVVRPFVAVSASGEKGGIVVSGIVTDNKKQPLPGVTIKLAASSVGTATDERGRFALRLPVTKGTLEFSFVGFKSQKVNFTETTKDSIRVVLVEDVTGLDEVSVVAYGSQKKRLMTSAVSSVKGKELQELPTHSLESLLQGRMAGVEVNNLSGAPGGGGSIVAIRGYNSLFVKGEGEDRQMGTPLYVVDGVPIHAFTSPVTGSNTLSDLDPSTIESVEVLKDAASAAIYGSRAGNGVILITTKKGRAGSKGKFSANVSYSASWLPETPVQTGGRMERMYNLNALKNSVNPYLDPETGKWKMPTSYEEVYHGADWYGPYYDFFWKKEFSERAHILQDSLNPFFNNSTDWYRTIYRTAKVWNANIQASGGSETMQYMIGAGYFKEQGIAINTDFQRANAVTNISVQPTTRLNLDFRGAFTYSDRSRGGKGTGTASKIEGIAADPTRESTLRPGSGSIVDEVLKELNTMIEKNHSYSARLSMTLKYDIIKNLNLSVSGSVDFNQQNQNHFEPSTLDRYTHFSASKGTITRSISLLNENLLNYSFKIKNDHNVALLLGLSFQKDQDYMNQGEGKNGPSDYIHYVDGWGTTNGLLMEGDRVIGPAYTYTSTFKEEVMCSYFGRINYNYKEKYILEGTLRRDGSSVFGEDVRWATFPSVSAGWAFSEEPFMKRFYWLSFGKIRASWGTSGQKFSQRYLAHGLFTPTEDSFLGNKGMIPDVKGGMINKRLTWEETDQYDLGLDVDFLDYRLKLVVDYYYRHTKKQLNRIDLPGDMYYHDMQWRNAAATSNEGLEVEVQADILRETAVKWRMRVNGTRNWSRLEKTANGIDLPGNVIGKPLYQIMTYKVNGYYNSMNEVPYMYLADNSKQYLADVDRNGIFFPGTRKIADLNGDGIITEDDQYYAASPLPKLYGGIVSELRWRNLDLNMLFSYSLGRHILKVYDDFSILPTATSGAIMSDLRKVSSWTGPESGNPDYPKLQHYEYMYNQYAGVYDCDIEKIHLLRLKQLTLGYNLTPEVAKKVGLSSGRVFVSFENLFLLTNYSGLDPEIVSIFDGKDNLRAYPLPRKFTIGLTLNF